MKKRVVYFILLTIIGAGSPMSAQGTDQEVDLQALYQQIDEAIDQSPQYVAKRRTQIADVRKTLLAEKNLEKQFALAEQLFELYKPFKNDSALHFADLCIALADSLNLKNKVGLYRSLKARQCSTVGLYVESLNLLKGVDKKALGPDELTEHYAALMHVYGEIGSYSQQEDEKWKNYNLQDSYRDSVLAVAEEGSEEYMHLKMDVLTARKQYQEALNISNAWLKKVEEGTHECAYADFYRSVVYEKLGNDTQQRYWLGMSALNDIKCAVYDQASLFMLAGRLCNDGDYERAYRYMRFSEACNLAFSPQLRNYQVRYISQITETIYEDSQTRYSRLLIIACVGGALLLLVIIWLLVRLRRKR